MTAIADLDPRARDLEGYLFPDTYAITRTASASTLIAQMVDRFKAVYQEALANRPRGDTLTCARW